MKTLVAAVLASAVSFGALAQTPAPSMSASAPMMKSSDSMSSTKMTKKHRTAKKAKMMKGASAPAA